VQFYEYDDRIEVQNPGGLYGKVNPANFPNVSDYRNPFIAEAMKVLGYVNRFSRGVYRVQKELVENGNGEASFDFSFITAFRVIEKISERYFEAGFGSDDNKENHPETTEKSQRNIQEKAKEKSQRKKPKKRRRNN
jgi:ATP-dependent DNA helicase RecG